MKTVSLFCDNEGRRRAYRLTLTFILIFGLCTLIAYTAFAATEADSQQTDKRTEYPTTTCSLTVGVSSNFLLFESVKYIEGTVTYHGINLQDKSLEDFKSSLTINRLKITADLQLDPDAEPLSLSLVCPFKDGKIGISVSAKQKVKELLKDFLGKKISL